MGHAQDIVARLAAQAVGTFGTTIFIGRMPDEPTAAIAIMGYPGMQPQYVHNQATPGYERPRFQVMARAATWTAADTLIRAAFAALASVRNLTINATRYLAFLPLQSPFEIQRDVNDQYMHAFNIEVIASA